MTDRRARADQEARLGGYWIVRKTGERASIYCHWCHHELSMHARWEQTAEHGWIIVGIGGWNEYHSEAPGCVELTVGSGTECWCPFDGDGRLASSEPPTKPGRYAWVAIEDMEEEANAGV